MVPISPSSGQSSGLISGSVYDSPLRVLRSPRKASQASHTSSIAAASAECHLSGKHQDFWNNRLPCNCTPVIHALNYSLHFPADLERQMGQRQHNTSECWWWRYFFCLPFGGKNCSDTHSQDTTLLCQRSPLPVSCKNYLGAGDGQNTGQRYVGTGRLTGQETHSQVPMVSTMLQQMQASSSGNRISLLSVCSSSLTPAHMQTPKCV